jgi:hypothetical protein
MQQRGQESQGMIMNPEADEPLQQLDDRPRRLYQAWKGNNVRASSIHLTRRLSFHRLCGSPPIQAHHVYSARLQHLALSSSSGKSSH